MNVDNLENGRAESHQPARPDRATDVLPFSRELRVASDRAASALFAAIDTDVPELDLLDAGITLGLTASHAGVPLDAFAGMLAELCSERHADRLTAGRQNRDNLLTRTAFKSFALAQAGAARREFRRLRHDLRNPLGTVRNSLALIGEELERLGVADGSVERLRAMAVRNSTSAEELLRQLLADSAAEEPWVGRRTEALATLERLATRTSPGDAAFRVRNETGGRALAVDAAALELALRIGLTVTDIADRGVPEVTVRWRDEQLAVALAPVRDGAARERATSLQRAVLACAGGHVVEGTAAAGALAFELPASAGDQRDDLARRREGKHGHAESG